MTRCIDCLHSMWLILQAMLKTWSLWCWSMHERIYLWFLLIILQGWAELLLIYCNSLFNESIHVVIIVRKTGNFVSKETLNFITRHIMLTCNFAHIMAINMHVTDFLFIILLQTVACGAACLSCSTNGAGKCDQGSCATGYAFNPVTKQCVG